MTATSGSCKNVRVLWAETATAFASPAGAGFLSFVGGGKATLGRLFREKGISLTPEAQARFDALPEQFLDFVAAPPSFAVRLEAVAA